MDFPGPVVTGRQACAHALRRPELSSNPGGPMIGSANLLFMDGEEHRRLRAVVREIVTGLEPLPDAVLARIRGIVAGLRDRDEIDLVADFGQPVAAVVASTVLSVRQELTYDLLDQLSETAANLDVWISGRAQAGPAMRRVVRFFLRADPVPGGGLDRLRRAAAAGEITEDELLVTPVMLTHAAYENSMNFLAAAALRIPGSPDLATTLAHGPGRAGTVRELVNGICPTRYVMRRATAPSEVDGTAIADGERLAVSIAPPDALPFGTGPHSCPGIRVALGEAEFALAEIAPLLAEGWEVLDVAEKDHFVFHGLTHAVLGRTR